MNHGLKLAKVHGAIKFNQKKWLKPYIHLNTKLRTEVKSKFEKGLCKLINNAVFGKIMEDLRNDCNIKLVIADKRRFWLASEPNYKAAM